MALGNRRRNWASLVSSPISCPSWVPFVFACQHYLCNHCLVLMEVFYLTLFSPENIQCSQIATAALLTFTNSKYSSLDTLFKLHVREENEFKCRNLHRALYRTNLVPFSSLEQLHFKRRSLAVKKKNYYHPQEWTSNIGILGTMAGEGKA